MADRDKLYTLLAEIGSGEMPLLRVAEILCPDALECSFNPLPGVLRQIVKLLREEPRLVLWCEPEELDGGVGFAAAKNRLDAVRSTNIDFVGSRLKAGKRYYRVSVRRAGESASGITAQKTRRRRDAIRRMLQNGDKVPPDIPWKAFHRRIYELMGIVPGGSRGPDVRTLRRDLEAVRSGK